MSKEKDIKIEWLRPKDLIPYDRNPRKNDAAIKEVAKSISAHGFNQPILVNQDLVICVGHTRCEAAKSLGLKLVPVVKREMTEEQFISYNIADNKTGELAEWDDDLLKENIEALITTSGPIEIPGFTDKELMSILGDLEEEGDEGIQDKKSGSKKGSSESTKLVYYCTVKEALEIDTKLDAIMKEKGFDNQVQAILFALKSFKGAPKTKTVKRRG